MIYNDFSNTHQRVIVSNGPVSVFTLINRLQHLNVFYIVCFPLTYIRDFAMTYITNKKLTAALALIEPTQTLIEASRVNGQWFLTVSEVA